MPIGKIESVDHEGRGIARVEGKAIFVDFALPGEIVEYASYRRKNSYELAHLVRLIKTSPSRIKPHCEYFGICGGCVLQHFEASAQLASKQRVLEDSLWHIGRIKAQMILPAIHGISWGYRHRARLSVRNVIKKSALLIGFHERKSNFVADMKSCAILPEQASLLLLKFRSLFARLQICDQLPQIEIAVGEAVLAVVLRILHTLSAADELTVKQFTNDYNADLSPNHLPIQFYLQSQGPDSVIAYYPRTDHAAEQLSASDNTSAQSQLYYTLPQFTAKNGQVLRFHFKPTEFTQVNFAVNRQLVNRAMQLLKVEKDDNIADFFCGLGNFTLPILSLGASVTGIELNEALIKRAYQQLLFNGWQVNDVNFYPQNLFTITPQQLVKFGKFNKWLIDPPREGAAELIKALVECPGEFMPEKIVYISCNPATLARDSVILVSLLGYQLRAAGIANMFPHTAHVESIAEFVRA